MNDLAGELNLEKGTTGQLQLFRIFNDENCNQLGLQIILIIIVLRQLIRYIMC